MGEKSETFVKNLSGGDQNLSGGFVHNSSVFFLDKSSLALTHLRRWSVSRSNPDTIKLGHSKIT
jgi:hypothetical protein